MDKRTYNFKDLTGQKFGRWTVLGFAYMKKKYPYYKCKCECGNEHDVLLYGLLNGRSKSCGCFKKEKLSQRELKHGMSNNRFYKIWGGMKQRCNCQKSSSYILYGGRGIKICDRWLKFDNFRDDMYKSYKEHINQYGKENTTIDRFPDNNGNYCPENTRWASIKQQNLNKNNNVLITYKEQTLTISQWSEKINISLKTLNNRINRGWNIEKALTSRPSQKYQSTNCFLTYKGQTLILKDWAKKLNLNYGTIWNRIKRGWNTEKVLTTPIVQMNKIITYQNTKLSLNDWAKKLNINRNTLYHRIYIHNWPIEKVLTTPIKNKYS